MHKTHVKPHRQHKLLMALLIVVCLLVLLRIALPTIIKSVANNQLKKESPYFSMHINDVDLFILKGRYAVKGITGTIKKTGEQFLTINSVVTQIPWKSMFRDHLVVADFLVNQMTLQASQSLIDNAKLEAQRLKDKIAEYKREHPEEEPEKETKVRVNFFALKDSRVTIHDFMSFKGDEVRTISDINVIATNLIPTANAPTTDFQLTANVFGPAPLNTIGTANLKDSPPSFDLNAVMKNFDLKSVNPFIKEKVQAYIQKGKLDFYSEVNGSLEKVEGYVKPFVSKMRMDTPPGGFKFKGAAAATGGDLVKVLLTDSEAKTLATEVPFKFEVKEKKLDLDIIPVLEKAVVHKAQQNIQPGIEDNVGRKGLGVEEGLIQAEEEK